MSAHEPMGYDDQTTQLLRHDGASRLDRHDKFIR